MTWWQALILGIVEGATEYLPVSSTGHLILAERVMGLDDSSASKAYAICIQGGAILAVLGLYRNHVKQMTLGVLGKDHAGKRMARNVLAAFLPAAVAGLALNHFIKSHLMGLWPIVFAWFVGGAAILLLAWYPKLGEWRRHATTIDHLSWRGAVIIGVVQCLGMWPGTSRSLVVIAGGLIVGLPMAAAVEFSFLLGVVTLLAATTHDAVKEGPNMVREIGWTNILIGVFAAAASAAVAVKWMVGFLNRRGLTPFAYYRIALAMIVAVLIVFSKLSP